MKQGLRVIISGGGTGGHIFPAISIANALKKLEPECEILFVGALGRMEMERVPAAGYPIVGLPVAGIKRELSAENLKVPFKLLKSLRMAGKIIDDFRPDIAVGVGGYASAPLLWMAGRRGIPYIIQEQNSFAGLTNRILGKKASLICVAYEGMERFFRREKIMLTGNPVRDGIKRADEDMKAAGCARFGIEPGKRCILVVGGSLGAGTLNRCLMDWIGKTKESDVTILWQTGKYYYKQIEEFNKKNPREYIRCYEFIREMDLAYAAAGIVISRAGAGTISELCIAEKATIFVPSPNVAEDHQTHNALSLVKRGAALMIPDGEAGERLMDEAIKLVSDNDEVLRLESGIAKLALKDSATVISREILKICTVKEIKKRVENVS